MSDSSESLVAFSGFGQPSIISGIPEQVKSAPRCALLFALAACDALGAGGGGGGSGAKVAESGTKRGSAGGYSAQLSSELGKQGVEPATIGAPGPAPKGTGSAAATAPAPTPAPAPAPGKETGSAATPAPTPAPANAGSAEKVVEEKVAPAPPTSTDTSTPKNAPAPPTPAKGIANRVPIKPDAQQAQIKFDLEPNWERDMGEAGTFSLVVKVPSTEEQRVFYARYSFEDQSAPPDCDSYKKFLEDKKLLTVTLNRQRGAACYIEGTDASGVAMYRYLLTYGGKRLMCTGSLYKDQASLGDLRDKVLMQAKKICETLAL